MPLHCCVPQCTKKGYRTATGDKISYFGFPKCDDLKSKWILAIRRDPGIDFRITDQLTKVCPRHFKQKDFKKSFNGRKILLKDGVVPSTFPWTVSPRKRKAPAVRIPPIPKAKAKEDGDEVEIHEPSTSKSLEDELQELKELNSNLQDNIKHLGRELNEVKAEKERLESKISDLISQLETEKQASLESIFLLDQAKAESEKQMEENEAIKARIFDLENLKSDENIAFYTGFPNYETLKAMFTFLNTDTHGENALLFVGKRSF